MTDHQYHIVESPRKLKAQLEQSNAEVVGLKKNLKTSQKKSRRLRRRVKSLKAIVKVVHEKLLISSGCEAMLKQTFSGVPSELMKRMTSGKASGKGCKYSPELRSFALTLQFYSTKAYEFVRRTFNLSLPHQSQIRRWYSKIPAEPGFTEPAFKALSAKVTEAQKEGKQCHMFSYAG